MHQAATRNAKLPGARDSLRGGALLSPYLVPGRSSHSSPKEGKEEGPCLLLELQGCFKDSAWPLWGGLGGKDQLW